MLESQTFVHTMSMIGNLIDTFGVVLMILGALLATVVFIKNMMSIGMSDSYVQYRTSVGKAILLGLEFLVAGDIIRTVAVAPNLTNVIILGGIVVIRTFLSMALQLEIEGRFSWQKLKA